MEVSYELSASRRYRSKKVDRKKIKPTFLDLMFSRVNRAANANNRNAEIFDYIETAELEKDNWEQIISVILV